MSIVDEMIYYRKTGNVNLLVDDCRIDIENLKDIIIEILSWLKLEYKRSMWIKQGRKTSLKPMELNMQYPWCVDLCRLVEKGNFLKDLFCIKENKLYFSDNITEEERESIRKDAFDKYNPQKRC